MCCNSPHSYAEGVARVGKLEEVSFADEARTWAGICVSEKLGHFLRE